jgi:HSP20 family protein
MANITRFDPFSSNLDDLFKGFWLRPMRLDVDLPAEPQIKLDVSRSDGAYTVKAEMPGVKKDDINVTVEGNQVTLSGEVKKESEEKKGEEVIRSERYYGKVMRSFTLPQEIDEKAVVAKYGDGVLKLTLPTKEHKRAQKIAIS